MIPSTANQPLSRPLCEMETFLSLKDNSQHPTSSGTVKVSNKGKVGKSKSLLSDVRKRLPSVKKCSHVEILNTAKIDNNINSPIVIIEDETSCVDILQRIKAVGLPKSFSSTLYSISVGASYQQKLNQPIFQSSVFLMKNLETLKNLEIETRNLLSKNVEKDKSKQKLLDSKVLTVLNPSKHIFSRLQPISFNVDQLMEQDETRLHNLAEKNAPHMRYRDPEIYLKDFIDCVVITKFPSLLETSFNDQCCQFHINPFTQHQIAESNNLIPYAFLYM